MECMGSWRGGAIRIDPWNFLQKKKASKIKSFNERNDFPLVATICKYSETIAGLSTQSDHRLLYYRWAF